MDALEPRIHELFEPYEKEKKEGLERVGAFLFFVFFCLALIAGFIFLDSKMNSPSSLVEQNNESKKEEPEPVTAFLFMSFLFLMGAAITLRKSEKGVWKEPPKTGVQAVYEDGQTVKIYDERAGNSFRWTLEPWLLLSIKQMYLYPKGTFFVTPTLDKVVSTDRICFSCPLSLKLEIKNPVLLHELNRGEGKAKEWFSTLVEQIVRKEAKRYAFTDLLSDVDVREKVEQSLQRELRTPLEKEMGVELLSVDLGDFEVDEKTKIGLREMVEASNLNKRIYKPSSEKEKHQETIQREKEKHEFDVEMKKLRAEQGLAARQALMAAKNEKISQIQNSAAYTDEQKEQLIEDVEDYYDSLLERTD